MGKKSSNKKGPDPLPAASPGPASIASDTWLEALPSDDRKLAISIGCSSLQELDAHKAKMAQAAKKASEQQQQQIWQNEKNRHWEKEAEKQTRKNAADERKWAQQALKTRERALREGVLESEDWGDGVWWCKMEDGRYLEVQGQYYCTLCTKHLNDHTLEGHLDSKDHQKKIAWNQWDGAEPASDSKATPKSSGNGIGIPSATSAMARAYPPPEMPYLAWVPCEEGSNERWLKCLLCSKWVQDDWSHSGTASAPDGSKEHKKNLQNYGPGDPWYDANITRVRLKYHPAVSVSPTSSSAAPSSKAGPAATAASVAPWAKSPPASKPASAPPLPPLPPGWESGADANGRTYYFNRATQESSWEPPPPYPDRGAE